MLVERSREINWTVTRFDENVGFRSAPREWPHMQVERSRQIYV